VVSARLAGRPERGPGGSGVGGVSKRTRSKAVLDERNERMLEALRLLCKRNRHGRPLSSREIAKACDFDHQTILLIERSALRKMRARLPTEMRAALSALLARDRKVGIAKPNQNHF